MKMTGMKEQKWRIYLCISYMKGYMALCIYVLENKQFNVFVIVLFP